ncbi:UNVERIFIED_CONTAM: Pentatricopeptide repeat-containing protein [Sesamum radiatum]|uniref:Pentatricopeptide repeat-containing protein n=1 Tax=Sesamum radiatum TaxID=300843 RepID=A0AAW2S734_SESRA
MELRLGNPPKLRLSSFKVIASSKETPDSASNSKSQTLQFRKLSKKDLSRILRTEAAIKAIERKANSSKYKNLWPKAVLEALSDAIKQNRWESALKYVEDMKSIDNCKPDAFTYSILIKYCLKLRHFDMIGLILEEMSHLGIECSTVIYNILIDGYGKVKRFELMENSLAGMIQSGKCCPDIFTFNSVVGAYGGCGRINEMEKWFDEFQLMGLKPDIMTYNILIRSYGNSGLYQKMGSVIEFMKKRFFSPTTVTYNIVIEIFGKAGNIVKMDEMFLKMKHQGLKPNSITYSSLVSAYGKARLLGKVDSILRQVENSDVVLDTPFFNCVINAYGNAGDVEKMMELLMAMEGCGCKPDNITFATIIQACRAQGMIGVAQNLESNMSHAKDTSETIAEDDYPVAIYLHHIFLWLSHPRNCYNFINLDSRFSESFPILRDIWRNLKCHKDADLQKGTSQPVSSFFCDASSTISQAYSDLIAASKKTLDSILELAGTSGKHPSITQLGEGMDVRVHVSCLGESSKSCFNPLLKFHSLAL